MRVRADVAKTLCDRRLAALRLTCVGQRLYGTSASRPSAWNDSSEYLLLILGVGDDRARPLGVATLSDAMATAAAENGSGGGKGRMARVRRTPRRRTGTTTGPGRRGARTAGNAAAVRWRVLGRVRLGGKTVFPTHLCVPEPGSRRGGRGRPKTCSEHVRKKIRQHFKRLPAAQKNSTERLRFIIENVHFSLTVVFLLNVFAALLRFNYTIGSKPTHSDLGVRFLRFLKIHFVIWSENIFTFL